MIRWLSVFVLCLFSTFSAAQVVQISSGAADNLERAGSGVLVDRGMVRVDDASIEVYCLTATHVILNKTTGVFPEVRVNHTKIDNVVARVVSVDIYEDVSLIRLIVPADMPLARLATAPAKLLDKLKFTAVKLPENGYKSTESSDTAAFGPTDDNTLFTDSFAFKGNSGGAIYNAGGELVGIIQGVGFMFKSVGRSGGWPTKSANLNPLLKRFEAIDE